MYENLGSRMEMQTRETELAGLLAFAAALFTLAAGALSVAWFRRL